MGFGSARPASKPSMLVGFVGATADAEKAKDAGADIVMVDARPAGMVTRFLGGANDVQADAHKLRDASGDVPAGLLASPDAEGVKLLKGAKLDFLAFEAEHTPAASLLDEDVGYVLAIPQLPDELFLRSLEPLNLEALYLNEVPHPLTVMRQIELSRTAMLAHKPIIAKVPSGVSSDDLQCLRAAGVVALLVENAADIAKVKEAVAALPVRKPKRDEARPMVSLPRGAAGGEEHEEEDE
jgi:hypothetical protein